MKHAKITKDNNTKVRVRTAVYPAPCQMIGPILGMLAIANGLLTAPKRAKVPVGVLLVFSQTHVIPLPGSSGEATSVCTNYNSIL